MFQEARYLTLWDTSGEEDVNIGEVLIKEGLAESISSPVTHSVCGKEASENIQNSSVVNVNYSSPQQHIMEEVVKSGIHQSHVHCYPGNTGNSIKEVPLKFDNVQEQLNKCEFSFQDLASGLGTGVGHQCGSPSLSYEGACKLKDRICKVDYNFVDSMTKKEAAPEKELNVNDLKKPATETTLNHDKLLQKIQTPNEYSSGPSDEIIAADDVMHSHLIPPPPGFEPLYTSLQAIPPPGFEPFPIHRQTSVYEYAPIRTHLIDKPLEHGPFSWNLTPTSTCSPTQVTAATSKHQSSLHHNSRSSDVEGEKFYSDE